jgi:hypothetical protein
LTKPYSPYHESRSHINTVQADNAIVPRPLEEYYDEVADTVSNVRDFYRLFEVPGLGHCGGGRSGLPVHLFEDLRAWVENGTAPDSSPVTITNLEGDTEERIICPYPLKPKLDKACGVAAPPVCWSCA